MDSNQELLQIIGQVYSDFYRSQYVIKQYQKQLKDAQDKIQGLQSELEKSKTTLKEFKTVVERNVDGSKSN